MNLNLPGEFGATVAVVYMIALAVVHVGFAVAIASDAGKLQGDRQGPLITGPFLWTLGTLLGGVFVAVLYWLVNHSTLSRRL
jgi:hypothetical protein